MDTIVRPYVSLYEQRVQLVAHALKQNSKLSKKAAADLAVHALYALDHIPEKVR
jgi:ABC-type transport system involved in cytochrome bd biosynthesis fused ATPase/permease subunit